MARVPTLYRLCAEAVASTSAEPLRAHYHRRLVALTLPALRVHYVTHAGTFASARLDEVMVRQDCWRVQTTHADAPGACRLELRLHDGVYVSTLFNLGGAMMRLDAEPGEYRVRGFAEGYVIARDDATPRHKDLAHVFSACHRGLCERQRDGGDEWRARIYDDCIAQRCDNSFFCSFYDGSRAYRALEHDELLLSQIPVLFYLNRTLTVDDLQHVRLTCATSVADVNNVSQCFYVYHSVHGRIGLAVQQTRFCGAYAQLQVLWSDTYTAMGNFRVCDNEAYGSSVPYVCRFVPCMCDYSFNVFVNKIKKSHWFR
ncbi:orf10-like protein [Peridroma alphabaculovirus]|uniref:Orf10-like protein n=1 Tax=Peridroma alphabaculovirus TaxID=1346829 RepID=A0A068LMF8_9ABAC|nr:orf10-like protein [Peridroma alphabaculovirus]AIE47741.1 orf10-like protein [Peridroma alphabaculovirus]